MTGTLMLALIAVIVAFAIYAFFNADEMSKTRAGKLMLLGGFLLLPFLALNGGAAKALKDSGSRDFCLSCHEMTPYQASLRIDDDEYLPAVHFQNHLVDPERACYECHTDYTMYGGIEAKISGLSHVWVHYFGDVPPVGEMALYKPYPNKNCLKCHEGARGFEESKQHTGKKAGLDKLYANDVSCLQKGCHDLGHGIDKLDSLDRWTRGAAPKKDTGADPFADEAGGGDDAIDDLFADDEAPAAPAAKDEIDDLFADDEAPTPAAPAAKDEIDDLFDDDDTPAPGPDADPVPPHAPETTP